MPGLVTVQLGLLAAADWLTVKLLVLPQGEVTTTVAERAAPVFAVNVTLKLPWAALVIVTVA